MKKQINFLSIKQLKKLFLFLNILVLLSCNFKPKTEQNENSDLSVIPSETKPVIINIERDFKNNKELRFSEIADDIEYIKLETTPECFLGDHPEIQASDDYFFIRSGRVVSQFTRNGDFIRNLNTEGRGPNEFGCSSYCVDPIDKKVFMLGFYSRNVYVSDFDGNISVIQYPESLRETYIRSIEKIPGNDMIILNPVISEGNSPDRFFIISGKGELLHKFPNPENYIHDYRLLESTIWPSPFTITANLKVSYKDQFSDTLFYLKSDLTLQPQYIFDLGKNKYTVEEYVKKGAKIVDISPERDKIIIMKTFETKHYLFFTHYSGTMYLGLFDKSDNTLTYNYKTTVVNNIDGSPNWDFNMVYQYKNTLYEMINAYELKAYVTSDDFKNSSPKYAEKKKQLIKLTNSLDENDNPVLMIAKLK